MAAYMIVLAQVHDRERFLSEYAPRAARLVTAHGGEYLLRAPGAECLEGDLGQGLSVVVSRWPDLAAARAFWDSPEYREAALLRRGICDAQVLLVEGERSAAALTIPGSDA
jgi:uncharacterized protein (DUF1330 family)